MFARAVRKLLRPYQIWWNGQRNDVLGIIGNGKAQSLLEPQSENALDSAYKTLNISLIPSLVEVYPCGYPRFAAFVGAHGSFHVCRRFSNLRARLLLLKQDELSVLEMELESLDQEEPALLLLGSRRHDKNEARQSVLSRIDHTLAEYDEMIDRNRRMLSLDNPKPQVVSNLQNWLDGNPCIARAETAYLSRSRDLVSVPPCNDEAFTRLEAWVETSLIRLCGALRKRTFYNDISGDENVYISSGTMIRNTTRAFISFFIVILLLGPVIVCNMMETMAARLGVVVVASIMFVAVTSGMAKARSVEVLVAASTYATVLVVFVSGTGSGNLP